MRAAALIIPKLKMNKNSFEPSLFFLLLLRLRGSHETPKLREKRFRALSHLHRNLLLSSFPDRSLAVQRGQLPAPSTRQKRSPTSKNSRRLKIKSGLQSGGRRDVSRWRYVAARANGRHRTRRLIHGRAAVRVVVSTVGRGHAERNGGRWIAVVRRGVGRLVDQHGLQRLIGLKNHAQYACVSRSTCCSDSQ